MRDVLGGTLIYAADLVPEIAGDIVNVDRAMRWGFAWRHGPFELIDRIGPAKLIALLRHEGRTLSSHARPARTCRGLGFLRKRHLSGNRRVHAPASA